MEAEVNQYGGSHMVMTNVMKEVKTRYVNMDTRFSQEFNHSNPVAIHTIEFPERIPNARSISVTNVEVPLSFYNVSENLENTTLTIIANPNTNPVRNPIVVPNGIYDATELYAKIQYQINSIIPSLLLTIQPSTTNPYASQFVFTSSGSYTEIAIQFSVNTKGAVDKYNLKSKLGWTLGFRQVEYTLSGTATTAHSEAMVDMNGPRYLYLAIDEFNNNAPQSTFVSMLPTSLLNRNILGRISVESSQLTATDQPSFGTIEIANIYNGLLLSDTREYSDDIDLQKMQVQLVDEYGRPVCLNGLDFSFTLAVKHT